LLVCFFACVPGGPPPFCGPPLFFRAGKRPYIRRGTKSTGMEAIIRFFRERREARLRKWCADRAAAAGVPGREFVATAHYLYEWVRGRAG